MTVCLLGLDGLEHSLVVDGQYSSLAQECCCKIAVPVASGEVPLTPTVWASFLAGGTVDVKFKLGWVQRALTFGKKVLPFVSLGLHKKVARPAQFPKLRCKTLLDFVEDSVAVNFPFVNYSSVVLEGVIDFYRGEICLDEAIDRSVKTFELEAVDLYEKIKDVLAGEPKLLLAYIHFPDILQHLAYQRKKVVASHYVALDGFVSNVKALLGADDICFVVSDHGFDFVKGLHSMYGFLSCSKQRVLPKSIIELHHLLKTELGEDSEEKQVVRNLKALGYM